MARNTEEMEANKAADAERKRQMMMEKHIRMAQEAARKNEERSEQIRQQQVHVLHGISGPPLQTS